MKTMWEPEDSDGWYDLCYIDTKDDILYMRKLDIYRKGNEVWEIRIHGAFVSKHNINSTYEWAMDNTTFIARGPIKAKEYVEETLLVLWALEYGVLI